MKRRRNLLLFLAAGLLSAIYSAPALSQDFSANLISTFDPRSSSSKARIYVSQGLIRIDVPPGTPRKGGAPFAAFTLWYANRQIRLLPALAKGQREDDEREMIWGLDLIHLTFQPADNSDLCAQYLSHLREIGPPGHEKEVSKQVGNLACENLGVDDVGGRKTQKLRVTPGKNPRGEESMLMWVDPGIHFLIKLEIGGTTLELQDIKEAAQPAGLFDIPKEARNVS